ncbi:MAG: protein kinase [Clostridia bacterium]|nr:protein kinase [Clostridia bacterium]
MEKLGTYELTGHLTSQNSGYSIWGFGKKNEKNYFIKQFLSPKYPANDTVSSPERLQKKISQCERFEQQKMAIYRMLNENSDGNAVRVEEFFRIESKYYISMRKIESLPWDAAAVHALGTDEVRRLCAIIAHGIAGIHKGGIVHADLKHDNVLFMYTDNGTVTAKIIDFDSSFLESAPPESGEEIVGDLVYFSPEACRSLWGEKPELTCKMDIFALGVLFHQYFTGELPGFDHSQSNYAGEAVAKGGSLSLSDALPYDLKDMFAAMLSPNPAIRPTAMEVYDLLAKAFMTEVDEPVKGPMHDSVPAPVAPVAAPAASTVLTGGVAESTKGANPFFRPGNL